MWRESQMLRSDEAKVRDPPAVYDVMDLYPQTGGMWHAISLERTQANADDATVDAIAREAAAPADIVKSLYEEEIARLDAQARLKQFVPVIAIKRVRERLRKLNQRRQ
jgi:hypothetical protein